MSLATPSTAPQRARLRRGPTPSPSATALVLVLLVVAGGPGLSFGAAVEWAQWIEESSGTTTLPRREPGRDPRPTRSDRPGTMLALGLKRSALAAQRASALSSLLAQPAAHAECRSTPLARAVPARAGAAPLHEALRNRPPPVA
jgi:hypothetical protein